MIKGLRGVVALGLRYITGRAGTGKTRRVYEEIKEALDAGHKSLILMVPEQFTLQAERDLVEKLNLPGLMNIEVLSFTRLAHKVFSQVGGLTRIHLDEQGRHMVLRKLLDDLSRKLTIYKSASKQDGFIIQMNDLISNLKKHDVNPDMLWMQAELLEVSLLQQKLLDTAAIYEAFNLFLDNRYLDAEDAVNLFIERMPEALFLQGTRIWIDGFDYMTPQTLRIIDKLMHAAQQLTLTFTYEDGDTGRDAELYQVHALSFSKVHRLAKENGLAEEYIHLSKTEFLKCVPEINHLEQELYRYPYRAFTGEVVHVEMFAGLQLQSEVENMAARMVSLARERKWRYKDMAVISGDMDGYGRLIKRIFEDYEIPFFLDQKRPVMDNPIIHWLLLVLRVIDRGYCHEDVFMLLKTGFCGLPIDAVETLENYCLEFGITRKRWREPFTLGEREYSIDALNGYREGFIYPLMELEEGLKGKRTVSERVRALYQYSRAVSLQEQLEVWIDMLRSRSLFEQVDEHEQIWNIVMEVLDQLVEILGDQQVPLKKFIRILEAGFSSMEVGIIPTTLDQVLVGNISRSKSQEIRALFVLGLNDGILPSGRAEEGLFGDGEWDTLHQLGIDLGSTAQLRAADEKFNIYTAFSKPSEYLWISYALSDQEGKALRPSMLVDRLKKMLPKMVPESDVQRDAKRQLHLIVTPNSTYKYLIEQMRSCVDGGEMQALWSDTYRWYLDQEAWTPRRQAMFQGLFHHNQEAPISLEKAARLYYRPIHSSVSRLEQYVNCPFAHFVRYGLKPRERKTYTVAAPDMGELFHHAIEGFTCQLAEEGLRWRELDEPQCERILEDVMEVVIPTHNHGVLLSTNRYRYLANRLKRISKRAIWLLTDHIRNGNFEPLGHEISFGLKGTYPPIEIELPDGERLFLEGRIDRADILIDGEETYIKVIDYKSGIQDFDLSDAYHGLKLQLLVYLEALLDFQSRLGRQRAKPAGIFYFKIEDPFIDTHEKIAEAVEAQIRKKMKLKGLALKDIRIVREMDIDLDGHSDILPLALKKDGSFYAYSSVMAEEEFLALLVHVKGLIRDLTIEMLRGSIRIEPIKKDQYTACGFCAYDGICQFDTQFEDNGYRMIRKRRDEDILEEILKGKEEKNDGELDSGTTVGD